MTLKLIVKGVVMGILIAGCVIIFMAYIIGGVWAVIGVICLLAAVLWGMETILEKNIEKNYKKHQQLFDEAITKLYTQESVILDTETTGLTQSSEIVEICITDVDGNILLDTLVRPKRKMRVDNKAVEIHGLTNEILADAPQWPDIHEQVVALLIDKNVIIYNAEYDERLLKQTAAKYDLSLPELTTECAMTLYGYWVGEKSKNGDGFRRHKLSSAAERLGVEIDGVSHRAATDCKTVAMIIKKMKEMPILPRR